MRQAVQEVPLPLLAASDGPDHPYVNATSPYGLLIYLNYKRIAALRGETLESSQ